MLSVRQNPVECHEQTFSREDYRLIAVFYIAQALGPVRTREELIPFLTDTLDDEDEVLMILAEELGNFLNLVGGDEFAFSLLNPLQALATVDESCVRDKAIHSICQVVPRMNSDQIETHFVPLIESLSTKDWFTSRVASCHLFSVAYAAISKQQPQSALSCLPHLRKLFIQLCSDDTPMVRRSAALNLSSFVEQMNTTTTTTVAEPKTADNTTDSPSSPSSTKVIETEMLPIFVSLSTDGQDSVRLQTIENAITFAQKLSSSSSAQLEIIQNQVIPVVLTTAADRSWRVRWSVANKYPELCQAMPASLLEMMHATMSSAFEKLLQDSEAEVRTAAAFKVSTVVQVLVSRLPGALSLSLFLEKLVPCFQSLATDTSEHVRSAFASVVMKMAPVFGKEPTIEHLLPLLLQLLRDSSSEVRLNVISNLEEGSTVIGMTLLSQSLLPAIVELAEDKQWRVRLAIIEYIPFLAAQVGVEFFDAKLMSLCLSWLGDAVFSIREAATLNLKRLSENFGPDWTCVHIVPQVCSSSSSGLFTGSGGGPLRDIVHNHNYLYRMTSLNAIRVLSDVLSLDTVQHTFLPLALQLTEDAVANIRFNAAKTLQVLVPHIDQSTVQEKVKPVLLHLQLDADHDVRYFATKALEVC